MGSRCTKRSTSNKSEPYPVCSIWVGADKEQDLDPRKNLIAVCPKRFFEIDFLNDVLTHCWPGVPPGNPKIAREVKMAGFGSVDFVIANEQSDGEISQFLSVELQAIDITGTVFPDYNSLRQNNEPLAPKPYGLNWDNVYKRYITQLIRKGYFHHHWKSKIIAVIQDQVYQNMVKRANFMRTKDVKNDPTVNIIFLTYVLEENA
jgi:Restriction endonuclease NotI